MWYAATSEIVAWLVDRGDVGGSLYELLYCIFGFPVVHRRAATADDRYLRHLMRRDVLSLAVNATSSINEGPFSSSSCLAARYPQLPFADVDQYFGSFIAGLMDEAGCRVVELSPAASDQRRRALRVPLVTPDAPSEFINTAAYLHNATAVPEPSKLPMDDITRSVALWLRLQEDSREAVENHWLDASTTDNTTAHDVSILHRFVLFPSSEDELRLLFASTPRLLELRDAVRSLAAFGRVGMSYKGFARHCTHPKIERLVATGIVRVAKCVLAHGEARGSVSRRIFIRSRCLSGSVEALDAVRVGPAPLCDLSRKEWLFFPQVYLSQVAQHVMEVHGRRVHLSESTLQISCDASVLSNALYRELCGEPSTSKGSSCPRTRRLLKSLGRAVMFEVLDKHLRQEERGTVELLSSAYRLTLFSSDTEDGERLVREKDVVERDQDGTHGASPLSGLQLDLRGDPYSQIATYLLADRRRAVSSQYIAELLGIQDHDNVANISRRVLRCSPHIITQTAGSARLRSNYVILRACRGGPEDDGEYEVLHHGQASGPLRANRITEQIFVILHANSAGALLLAHIRCLIPRDARPDYKTMKRAVLELAKARRLCVGSWRATRSSYLVVALPTLAAQTEEAAGDTTSVMRLSVDVMAAAWSKWLAVRAELCAAPRPRPLGVIPTRNRKAPRRRAASSSSSSTSSASSRTSHSTVTSTTSSQSTHSDSSAPLIDRLAPLAKKKPVHMRTLNLTAELESKIRAYRLGLASESAERLLEVHLALWDAVRHRPRHVTGNGAAFRITMKDAFGALTLHTVIVALGLPADVTFELRPEHLGTRVSDLGHALRSQLIVPFMSELCGRLANLVTSLSEFGYAQLLCKGMVIALPTTGDGWSICTESSTARLFFDVLSAHKVHYQKVPQARMSPMSRRAHTLCAELAEIVHQPSLNLARKFMQVTGQHANKFVAYAYGAAPRQRLESTTRPPPTQDTSPPVQADDNAPVRKARHQWPPARMVEWTIAAASRACGAHASTRQPQVMSRLSGSDELRRFHAALIKAISQGRLAKPLHDALHSRGGSQSPSQAAHIERLSSLLTRVAVGPAPFASVGDVGAVVVTAAPASSDHPTPVVEQDPILYAAMQTHRAAQLTPEPRITRQASDNAFSPFDAFPGVLEDAQQQAQLTTADIAALRRVQSGADDLSSCLTKANQERRSALSYVEHLYECAVAAVATPDAWTRWPLEPHEVAEVAVSRESLLREAPPIHSLYNPYEFASAKSSQLSQQQRQGSEAIHLSASETWARRVQWSGAVEETLPPRSGLHGNQGIRSTAVSSVKPLPVNSAEKDVTKIEAAQRFVQDWILPAPPLRRGHLPEQQQQHVRWLRYSDIPSGVEGQYAVAALASCYHGCVFDGPTSVEALLLLPETAAESIARGAVEPFVSALRLKPTTSAHLRASRGITLCKPSDAPVPPECPAARGLMQAAVSHRGDAPLSRILSAECGAVGGLLPTTCTADGARLVSRTVFRDISGAYNKGMLGAVTARAYDAILANPGLSFQQLCRLLHVPRLISQLEALRVVSLLLATETIVDRVGSLHVVGPLYDTYECTDQ